MTMIYHPNFPPSLFITSNVDRLTNYKGDGGDAAAFGAEAQREAISRYGIAGRVWEAAYALCAYIDPVDGDVRDFDPPFAEDLPLGVIELGSGTGVLAARVARAIRRATRPGGFVIATDLPDVCPLLQHNFGITPCTREGNRSKSDVVFVRPLAWGNLDHVAAIAREFGARRLTHIVCSDLVYFPELFGPLLRTLIHLTSLPWAPSSESGPPVKSVISYKIRSISKETPFWSAFGLWFSFHPILARHRVRPIESKHAPLDDEPDATEVWRQFGTLEDTDRTFVFVAHRRPESFAWHVPETDKELMEGVGARGTAATKGDDTFETILLMSMGIDNTSE
ncbi:hypothetical protein OG21DRAFT_1505750 [Imleria badia]|nr:hypothetical protein OG21DRAFT_1505750 [Imleria badia]